MSVAYFHVPEGRGGILTLLHGRADILKVLPCIAVAIMGLGKRKNLWLHNMAIGQDNILCMIRARS